MTEFLETFPHSYKRPEVVMEEAVRSRAALISNIAQEHGLPVETVVSIQNELLPDPNELLSLRFAQRREAVERRIKGNDSAADPLATEAVKFVIELGRLAGRLAMRSDAEQAINTNKTASDKPNLILVSPAPGEIETDKTAA